MKSNRFQSPPALVPLFLCLMTGTVWIAGAQTERNEPADVADLRAEVRRLASELLQYRAELIEWKMQIISVHLQQVQAERQRLAGERQIMEREIGELSQGSIGAGDEERREELKTVQLPALLTGERAASEREASLAAALGAETARMNEIHKQVERLAARAPGHK